MCMLISKMMINTNLNQKIISQKDYQNKILANLKLNNFTKKYSTSIIKKEKSQYAIIYFYF